MIRVKENRIRTNLVAVYSYVAAAAVSLFGALAVLAILIDLFPSMVAAAM